MKLKTIASITALASALVCTAAEMPFIDVLKPDKILVDGAEDSAGRVELWASNRSLRQHASVNVSGEAPVSKIELIWNVSLPKDALVYGSDWERTYGDSGWFRIEGSCGPVYGCNDWYCAYGNNTAENFLADAAFIVSLVNGEKVRSYVVVDDGWQRGKQGSTKTKAETRWAGVNGKWGMEMDEFARPRCSLSANRWTGWRTCVPCAGALATKSAPTTGTDALLLSLRN